MVQARQARESLSSRHSENTQTADGGGQEDCLEPQAPRALSQAEAAAASPRAVEVEANSAPPPRRGASGP